MGPLEGVLVLDLGQYLAGPYAPMILSDLGAEVIKIEPVSGDGMRMAGKPFLGCQRGKKDIAVDLKTPEGIEIVMQLVERADIVHHNMTKGTAARLGVDYETLRDRNEDLIHCNTYAYAPEGPMSEFGGLDPLYQATAGLEHEAGPVAEGNPPLYLRFGMTDTASAFASVVGVLAALFHQRRTGEGQDVWSSLFNASALFSSDVFLLPDGTPSPSYPLDRNQTGLSPCYRLYETQEGWLQVAAVGTEQWGAMCRSLGHPELADDPRYASFSDRAANRAAIEPKLEAAFLAQTARAWQIVFDDAGVPAEVSVDTHDGELALYDADNERLGLMVDSDHAMLGRVRQFGALIDFSATPCGPFGAAPMMGQHTREILRDLDFDDNRIDSYISRGIVYEPDDHYPWMH